MKTILTIFISLSSLLFFGGWLIIVPYTVYTEKDIFKYYALTYKEIRDVPRLSKNYYFSYEPSDEAKPQISTIYLCDLDNINEAYNKLLDYVNSTGVPLVDDFSLGNYPSFDEYFQIIRIKEKDRVTMKEVECLMLDLSKEQR
ncbi:hypothetical protein [Pectobacterium carotovorum]|uniref:hypothetical protein n=1 Tax=Pectobacterium carotovorum TaxID=554 RepID=UPI0005009F76|nr:hypothetical protein [Pectobacterium carotovorum]KFX02087.1 hypothetical protein JV33_02885 [Pectobacterium carotovorum subsp. carotovorum]KML71952.1 hypothetical protein G032_02435 [Pectobacterium carotovorum subsp. carotovorum ICMP 5702]QHP56941.1 hypothetical protein EH204_02465 [Pectobacterium carotovorum subsp. carotovorum]SHG36026.1 hypothetical protein SAMN05444147_102248 [Pectobacterium carotovorum]GKW08132.1 hypothetical protein PEC301889_26140 [Pectobacterium carotovorum subsp. ca